MSASPRPAPGPLSVSDPWDLVSKGYADESASIMLPFTRDAIQLAQPAANARVLDVATGPGVLALELAPRVARVDAVDFSRAMLDQLEIRRATSGLENVFARVADGQALPFEDASFDVVFSMFGLMFFPDRSKGFAEAARVLRPGGVVVVSSWAPVAESPLMMLMFGALCAADPSRAAPQTNLLSLENPERFAQELEAAGLEDVSVTPYTHGLWVEDADGFWESMSRASAPIVMLKNRLRPEEWERQSRLAKGYIAERLTEPRELTTTAYLGFGRRRAR